MEEIIRRAPRLDYANSDYADVPLLKGKLGLGQPFPVEGRIAGYRAFLREFVSKFHRPLLVVVSPKEEAMVPTIRPLDLVLLDTDPEKRKTPELKHIYAVSVGGGSGLRHCGLAGSSLMLMPENPRWPESHPTEVRLEGLDILSIVRGRVVWTGREL